MKKNRRGRNYRWRIDKLKVTLKQQEFQEITENAEQFSELLESIGTTRNAKGMVQERKL